ncbi:hypothetical protein I5R65_07725 [Herbaspirillum sp. AP02]|uniref:hypothetical protein n=1 Tax=unclassified Herbaspirillum TaxID=2624150 RepID=UPI0015DB832B|nr:MULTISPECIES: hypothetical protein [unclassified Herbaspirillum]MBG7619349.1 hypothetical protein [Herbaspirillum sp. AP02]NZD66633.1 hypothetical protein [Herbaspirillum sp. AP21]
MSGGISATTVALAATAAVGAYSAIQSGQSQSRQLQAQAQQQSNQAAYEKDAAVAQAEKIRKAAAQQQSAARAQLAGSGVAVSEGTAVTINDTIDLNAENDAQTALLTGSRRSNSLNDTAASYSSAAGDALTGGYLTAGATVLSSAARIGKGWSSTSPTASGSALGSGVKVPTGALSVY